MKKQVPALIILLLVVCYAFARGNSLNGSVWQYDPYDDQERIAFYGNGIYIWIDEDIAYPDPAYWSKHTTVYLYDKPPGTIFCANVLPIPIPFGLGYSGQANINTASGTLYHWFILPRIVLLTSNMDLIDTNFLPYQTGMELIKVYDLDTINDKALREKINSDMWDKFLRYYED